MENGKGKERKNQREDGKGENRIEGNGKEIEDKEAGILFRNPSYSWLLP